MPATVTGTTLQTMARERIEFDAGSSPDFLVTDAELYRYLDGEWDRLYGKLVKAHPERYTKVETITGDGSTIYYSLPSDYLGTVGIDWQSTTGIWSPLEKIYALERNNFDYSQYDIPWGYQFRMADPGSGEATVIEILPHISSGEVCRHLYTKARTPLNDDADTVPDEYNIPQLLAISAALRMLIKEESSAQWQMMKQEQRELAVDLDAAVQNRQVQEVARITKRRTRRGGDPDILRWKFPK